LREKKSLFLLPNPKCLDHRHPGGSGRLPSLVAWGARNKNPPAAALVNIF
jgi:hypothetical protein